VKTETQQAANHHNAICSYGKLVEELELKATNAHYPTVYNYLFLGA
jgi:hypothetical protein